MTQLESWEHFVGLNWTDRFNDPPDEEEEIDVDLLVDATNLSEEDFDTLVEKVEDLHNLSDEATQKSEFNVDYVCADDEETATGFTIKGWCCESVYEELMECLDYYDVKFEQVA